MTIGINRRGYVLRSSALSPMKVRIQPSRASTPGTREFFVTRHLVPERDQPDDDLADRVERCSMIMRRMTRPLLTSSVTFVEFPMSLFFRAILEQRVDSFSASVRRF